MDIMVTGWDNDSYEVEVDGRRAVPYDGSGSYSRALFVDEFLGIIVKVDPDEHFQESIYEHALWSSMDDEDRSLFVPTLASGYVVGSMAAWCAQEFVPGLRSVTAADPREVEAVQAVAVKYQLEDVGGRSGIYWNQVKATDAGQLVIHDYGTNVHQIEDYPSRY